MGLVLRLHGGALDGCGCSMLAGEVVKQCRTPLRDAKAHASFLTTLNVRHSKAWVVSHVDRARRVTAPCVQTELFDFTQAKCNLASAADTQHESTLWTR